MTYSPIPKWTITDTNGEPVVGGTLEFYEPGTSTPKNVYSDAARTVSLGATETTDSLGQVGPLYFDTAEGTKVVCKDADDATLWTVDNLTAPSGSSGVSGSSGISRATSPLDYGAVGDGAADEASEVQQAIDAATGEIDLAGKTYRCDSTLTLGSGKTIRNGVLDFSQCTDTYCLSIRGASVRVDGCTAPVIEGGEVVSIGDTSAYSAGDWVLLGNGATYCSLPAASTQGEMVRIKAIDSGTNMSLASNTHDGYSTLPSLTLLSTVQRACVRGVKIVCANASTQYGIFIEYADSCVVDQCVIDGAYTYGVAIDSCAHCVVTNTSVTDAQNGAGVGIVGYAYKCTVDSCNVDNCPSGIVVGGNAAGVARLINLSSVNVSGATGVGILLNGDTERCSVNDCTVTGGENGSSEGIYTYGTDCTVTGCLVTRTDDSGIVFDCARKLAPGGEAPGFTCVGNTIDTDGKGIYVRTQAATLLISECNIHGNTIQSANEGIDLDFDYGCAAVSVSDNVLGTCASTAIAIVCQTSADSVNVSGNTVSGVTSGSAIDISAQTDIYGLRVSNNVLSDFTLFGIRIDNTSGNSIEKAAINNNVIESNKTSSSAVISIEPDQAGEFEEFTINGNTIDTLTTGSGIELKGPSRFSVSGNTVSGSGMTSGGIVVEAETTTAAVRSEEVSITGNILTDCGTIGIALLATATNSLYRMAVASNVIDAPQPIKVDIATSLTCEGLSITGNNIRQTGANVAVSIVGADADSILRTAVSGNALLCENDGIFVDNGKHLSIVGNTVHCDGTEQAPFCIRVDTPNIAGITGNTCTNDDTLTAGGSCIEVTGTSCNTVLVQGNCCAGGYQSIVETVTTPTLIMADGNLMSSFGAGSALVGTWTLGVSSNTAADFKSGY